MNVIYGLWPLLVASDAIMFARDVNVQHLMPMNHLGALITYNCELLRILNTHRYIITILCNV